MNVSKKRPQPKKELMKLVKDEMQLRSSKFNAAVFIDLVKDRVCDWIIMHNFRPAKKERVSITRVTFEPGWEMQALAEYRVSPWKQYSFYTGKMYKKKKTYMPIKIPKLSREDIYEAQERQKQRRRLLLLIDVKYGGIENAEGTPELEELRQMIGAYEDGRKKGN